MAEQDVLAKLIQKGGRGIWGSGKNTLEVKKDKEYQGSKQKSSYFVRDRGRFSGSFIKL